MRCVKRTKDDRNRLSKWCLAYVFFFGIQKTRYGNYGVAKESSKRSRNNCGGGSENLLSGTRASVTLFEQIPIRTC